MKLSDEIISAVETVSKYSVLLDLQERGAYSFGSVADAHYEKLTDKEKSICDLHVNYKNMFIEELKKVLESNK